MTSDRLDSGISCEAVRPSAVGPKDQHTSSQVLVVFRTSSTTVLVTFWCFCTCLWLLQIVQLTTFGVNYVGHPFNSGLSENAGMLRSLRYSSCFLVLLVSEAVPALNER